MLPSAVTAPASPPATIAASMQGRPCLISVWCLCVKFSTLPSAVTVREVLHSRRGRLPICHRA
eukprot:10229127-Prorocentrum_lima.AAC.1